jgi:hypothetical protein
LLGAGFKATITLTSLATLDQLMGSTERGFDWLAIFRLGCKEII